MALASDQMAYMTARCGAMRCGAVRTGFVPKDTVNASGTGRGFFYKWAQVLRSAISWTTARD